MGKSSALSTSNQYIKYTIEIIQNSQSIPNNTSNVTVKVRFYRTNTGYETYGTGTVYCKINGTQYSASVTPAQKITNSGIDLFTKTLDIQHGTDGVKKLTCSAWISHDAPLTSSEQSYSQDLTKIPRYPTVNHSLQSKTETSINVNWSSDSTIDYVWYSTDGGTTWIDVGYVNSSSGSYTILTNSQTKGGLAPGTTYHIITSLRRKDSQLYKNSSMLSVDTYWYPYCTYTPNFTIGDALELQFYNPLGRTISITGIANSDGSTIFVGTTTGTSLKGFNDSASVNNQYKSIPNSQSGTYKVRTEWNGYTWDANNGNTYQIRGTETPTVNGITYQDTDDDVIAITQDNQLIVQNQSNLTVNFEKATPNYNAGSIKKYTFELNGVIKESTSAGGMVDFGKVNSVEDLTLTMTVTDSRGLTAQKELEIPMLPHSEPTATVTLERLNNYEDETYLTVDASISSVNGKNTMAIQYRYKISGGSNYGSFSDIGNKETLIKEFDKNSSYIFNVVVTDIFGAKFDKEYVLDKGKFPLFIDTEKNAIGINDFPAENEALRVKEGVAHFIDGIKIAGNQLADYIVEQGTGGIWNYRKWSSGIAECWCKYHAYDVNCSQKNYSGFYYSEEIVVDLPIDFKTISQFTTSGGSSDNLNFARPSWCDISADKVYFLMMCLVPTMTNATINVYISVKGTWK